jgi:Galactose oxidase, central domain
MNDFWKFDLNSNSWQKLLQEGDIPQPRSGHTLSIKDDCIFMFGGLLEITKEVNDTYRYEIATSTWANLRLCPKIDYKDDFCPSPDEGKSPKVLNSRNSPDIARNSPHSSFSKGRNSGMRVSRTSQ